MPTQCRPEQLVFAPVEGRSVVASFTGGAITSDAGVDLPPSSGGDRSEDQAAFRMVIASMLARASAGVR